MHVRALEEAVAAVGARHRFAQHDAAVAFATGRFRPADAVAGGEGAAEGVTGVGAGGDDLPAISWPSTMGSMPGKVIFPSRSISVPHRVVQVMRTRRRADDLGGERQLLQGQGLAMGGEDGGTWVVVGGHGACRGVVLGERSDQELSAVDGDADPGRCGWRRRSRGTARAG